MSLHKSLPPLPSSEPDLRGQEQAQNEGRVPVRYQVTAQPNDDIPLIPVQTDYGARENKAHVLASAEKEYGEALIVNNDLNGYVTELDHGKAWRAWRPIVLEPSFSISFAVILLLFVGSLEAINRLSSANHGFPAPSYPVWMLWTYLPVLVLVVISWVWQSYELEVKKLVPWAVMKRGPSPAQDSILLDYIGADYIGSVRQAFSKRHVPVLLTFAGSIVISIAGIVATSLWSTEQTTYSSPTNLIRTSVLNGTQFNTSSADQRWIGSYWGRELYNLSSPPWVYEQFALESFNVSTPTDEMLLSDSTTGYGADLSCSPVAATYDGNVTYLDSGSAISWIQLILTIGECSQLKNFTSLTTQSFDAPDWSSQPPFYSGRVLSLDCPDLSTSVLIMAFFDGLDHNITAVACEPFFSQVSFEVSVNASSLTFSKNSVIIGSEARFTLPDANGLLQWINGLSNQEPALSGTDPFFEWTGGAIVNSLNSAQWTPGFDPWIYLVSGSTSLNATHLLDPAVLISASRTVFSNIWTDVAHYMFFSPSTDIINGAMTLSKNRLLPRVLSLRVMQAALSALAIVTLTLLVVQPRTNIPCDPSSFAAMALMLRASGTVSKVLEHMGDLPVEEMIEKLNGQQFWTTEDQSGHFSIATECSEPKTPPHGLETHSPAMLPGWRPFMLNPIVYGTLIVLLLGAIAALESLYRSNLARGGLSIGNVGSLTYYVWIWTWPAIVFIFGLVLSSHDFSVRSMEPFLSLYDSSQPASRVATYNPSTHGTATIIRHGLGNGQYISLANVAIPLLIAVMKIAVAGLFTTGTTSISSNSNVDSLDTFNTNNISLVRASVLLPLTQIPDYALSLPLWMMNTLAVGEADLPSITAATAQSTLVARLPVAHSELVNCVVADAATYNISQISMGGGDGEPDQLYIVVTFHNDSDQNTYLPDGYGYRFQLSRPPGDEYFGWQQLTGQGNGTAVFIYGNAAEEPEDADPLANGYGIGSDIVIVCQGLMTQSTMNVTFVTNNGSYELVSADWSSEEDMVSASSWTSSIELETTGLASYMPADLLSNETALFDSFFQVVRLHDPNTSLEDFMIPNVLYSAISSQWSAFWALVASTSMRQHLPPGSLGVQATVTSPQPRLFQNAIVTRLMEALIAAAALCALVTGLMLRGKRVLPKPLYSIGAQMSLLAGSRFLEVPELNEGLGQRCTEAQLRTALRSYWFRLGWWYTPEGQRFGIDVDVPQRTGSESESMLAEVVR